MYMMLLSVDSLIQKGILHQVVIQKLEDIFKNVFTKDGQPYAEHCTSVMFLACQMLQQHGKATDDMLIKTCIAALAHDILEDLGVGPFNDFENFCKIIYQPLNKDHLVKEAMDCVKYYLTHYKKVSRQDYIENIVKGPLVAKYCKLADLTHNSMISRRKPNTTFENHIAHISKYAAEYDKIFASM